MVGADDEAVAGAVAQVVAQGQAAGDGLAAGWAGGEGRGGRGQADGKCASECCQPERRPSRAERHVSLLHPAVIVRSTLPAAGATDNLPPRPNSRAQQATAASVRSAGEHGADRGMQVRSGSRPRTSADSAFERLDDLDERGEATAVATRRRPERVGVVRHGARHREERASRSPRRGAPAWDDERERRSRQLIRGQWSSLGAPRPTTVSLPVWRNVVAQVERMLSREQCSWS